MQLKLMLVLSTGLCFTGCGRKDDGQSQPNAAAPASDATEAPVAVRACKEVKASAKPPALALQAGGVTYANDLFPVMEVACAECHRGDIENRQNSTNCFYMRDNIVNLIQRLENSADAAVFKAANPAATDDEIRARYADDERPMPPIGGNRVPLTGDEIDLFRAWRDSPNKCEEGAPVPEDAVINPVTDYSSDADEHESFEKLFATASCEDGPLINTEQNWALVQPLLQPEADAPSAFYDYATRAYVPGATSALEVCDYDSFIASLGDIVGIDSALRPYEQYGWRLTQCAVVGGLPMASLVAISRTKNTLGDTILGLNYKTVTIDAAKAE